METQKRFAATITFVQTVLLLKRTLFCQESQRMHHDVETAIWTIPNSITVCRMVSTPVLSWLIYTGEIETALYGWSMNTNKYFNFAPSLVLHFRLHNTYATVAAIVAAGLVLAGLSDAVDGYIARRFNQQSKLGSILDPLADKALVGAVALPLALTGALQPWVVALMITRDVGLVLGVLVMRSGLTPVSGVSRQEALRRVKTSAKNIKSMTDLKKEAAIDPAAPFEPFEINPTRLSKVHVGLQIDGLIGTKFDTVDSNLGEYCTAGVSPRLCALFHHVPGKISSTLLH